MKLYTEEQAKYFFECGRNYQNNAEITFRVARDEIPTKPIELPSDEEVHKSSPHQILNSNNSWDIGFHNGWKHGAKWMRDKIQEKITPNQ